MGCDYEKFQLTEAEIQFMKWEDFKRSFKRDSWRAFKNGTFPIRIPQTAIKRETHRPGAVFDAVRSAP